MVDTAKCGLGCKPVTRQGPPKLGVGWVGGRPSSPCKDYIFGNGDRLPRRRPPPANRPAERRKQWNISGVTTLIPCKEPIFLLVWKRGSGGDRGGAVPLRRPEDDLGSRIFRLRFPKRSATAALDKWVAEGREVTATELRRIARDLRRSQRYKHALEISEWMKTHEDFELSDSEYAMCVDLITKVFGANAAEEFFQGLRSAAKSSETFAALHSFASTKLTEKAEELFERIKELNFCSSVLTFNEMMTMYMSVGRLDKVSAVIEKLKMRKVSPDLFTYNLWISSCAATLDIDGVRRILDEMARDSNSDKRWETYMKMTDIYITASHLVNSDSSLVETEKKSSQREWITYDFLIILYAGLGNRERVNEIWRSLRLTSQKMTSRNYICILSSCAVLGQLKEAGEVIDEWKQSKVLDFDILAVNRLYDALRKVGLPETAETFQELLLQKDCQIITSFGRQ